MDLYSEFQGEAGCLVARIRSMLRECIVAGIADRRSVDPNRNHIMLCASSNFLRRILMSFLTNASSIPCIFCSIETISDGKGSDITAAEGTKYPAMTDEEIEEWLSHIPVFAVTDSKGQGVVLRPDNDTSVFYFFMSPQMANATLQTLKGANEDMDLRISAFSLGKIWFRILNAGDDAAVKVGDAKQWKNGVLSIVPLYYGTALFTRSRCAISITKSDCANHFFPPIRFC